MKRDEEREKKESMDADLDKYVRKLKTPVVMCYRVIMPPCVTTHFTPPQHYNAL